MSNSCDDYHYTTGTSKQHAKCGGRTPILNSKRVAKKTTLQLYYIYDHWFSQEILKCIVQVINIGFFIRAVVADNHSANVNAFNISLDKFEGDKKFFITMYFKMFFFKGKDQKKIDL